MSTYKQFKTDSGLEQDGVEFSFGDAGVFLLARAGSGNKRYVTALERVFRKYRRQLQLDVLPNEVQERALQEVYADTVVRGWEDVTGEDELPLPFTRANCLKLFRDLPDLWRGIRDGAEMADPYKEYVEGLEEKNLPTSSSTTSE